jgi:hypothetical protein
MVNFTVIRRGFLYDSRQQAHDRFPNKNKVNSTPEYLSLFSVAELGAGGQTTHSRLVVRHLFKPVPMGKAKLRQSFLLLLRA